jgi:putative transposase
LKDFDYSGKGAYFITAVTPNRKPYFGRVENEQILLSNAGTLANELFKQIEIKFKKVTLYEYCILPDHIHCILLLFETEYDRELWMKYRPDPDDSFFLIKPHLPIQKIQNTPGEGNQFSKHKKGSVSLIIQQFKAGVTRECGRKKIFFAWHDRFHMRVITSEADLRRIRAYLRKNPANWKN